MVLVNMDTLYVSREHNGAKFSFIAPFAFSLIATSSDELPTYECERDLVKPPDSEYSPQFSAKN